jgi:hypothetical protein
VRWNGYCFGAAAPTDSNQNIRIYNPTGQYAGGLKAGTGSRFLFEAAMALSGDNLRLVTALESSGLSILNMP